MSYFTNENILSTPSRFITEYKMITQNCHSLKRCQDKCYINWLQDFHLMLYLNSQFLLVKYRKNAETYTIKLPNLSTTRECNDEPEGPPFS